MKVVRFLFVLVVLAIIVLVYPASAPGLVVEEGLYEGYYVEWVKTFDRDQRLAVGLARRYEKGFLFRAGFFTTELPYLSEDDEGRSAVVVPNPYEVSLLGLDMGLRYLFDNPSPARFDIVMTEGVHKDREDGRLYQETNVKVRIWRASVAETVELRAELTLGDELEMTSSGLMKLER